MTEAGQKARTEYMREWRKKNPAKIKKYQANFWERQAKKLDENTQNKGEK